jgi:hypothetical protein
MPHVGFEPTIPVFEWAKTVHALDRAATVIGKRVYLSMALLPFVKPRPLFQFPNPIHSR